MRVFGSVGRSGRRLAPHEAARVSTDREFTTTNDAARFDSRGWVYGNVALQQLGSS